MPLIGSWDCGMPIYTEFCQQSVLAWLKRTSSTRDFLVTRPKVSSNMGKIITKWVKNGSLENERQLCLNIWQNFDKNVAPLSISFVQILLYLPLKFSFFNPPQQALWWSESFLIRNPPGCRYLFNMPCCLRWIWI